MVENASGRNSCLCVLNVLVPKAYKAPEFVEHLRALLTEEGLVSLECKVGTLDILHGHQYTIRNYSILFQLLNLVLPIIFMY